MSSILLHKVNWSCRNPEWEEVVFQQGKVVSRKQKAINGMKCYLKNVLEVT